MATGAKLWARGLKIDVTPERSSSLGAGGGPGLAAAEPLELNILELQDENTRILIASLDTLYCPTVLREVIASEAKLARGQVMVAASHSHNAPMIDSSKPGLGALDQEYLTRLISAAKVAIGNLKRVVPEEVTVLGAQGEANHSINRRRRKSIVISKRPQINAYVNAPNPEGPRDENVTLILGVSENGDPTWALWNYACHPVAYPYPGTIAAHYPNVVRQRTREHYGLPNLPVIFLQGFSGDTRPAPSVRVTGLERRIRRLVTGPLFSNLKPSAYLNWADSLASVVLGLTSKLSNVHGGLDSRYRELPLNQLVRGGSGVFPVQRFRIGDCTILGVGAEVVSEYGPLLRAEQRGSVIITAGCVNEVFGYLPTRRIIEEGGYEAGGYCAKFGLESLDENVETTFLQAANSLDDI